MKRVLEKCVERNLLLHPDTVTELEENDLEESVLEEVFSLPEGTVVTPKHLRAGNGGTKKTAVSPQTGATEPGPKPVEKEPSSTGLDVLMDATGESEGEGELDDFRRLFTDRLDSLRRILENRQGLNPRRIDTIHSAMDREVTVVGMVSSVSRTGKGHALIRIEDEGGEAPALVLKSDEELLQVADTLMEDEVVGVVGRKRRESDLLLVEDLFRPDVPTKDPGRGPDVYAAFISDVHVGSDTFLEEELGNFFSWLNGEVGDEKSRRIAADTRFLVIAGDLVEGVGVYPNQESHLTVTDLRGQYEEAAALLDTLPSDLEIVIAPGNHDAVRQAEPQPAIRDEYADALDVKNVTLVSNPSIVSLDGVKSLVYHGRSLDDVMAAIPGVDYAEPTEAMKELLRRRHLAPTYGSKTPISPEKKDFLVIDDVPDIVHSGHVHTFGIDSYRGVTVINSGTWQSQTDFQKRMGIEPDPGMVPLVNLADGTRKILRFA